MLKRIKKYFLLSKEYSLHKFKKPDPARMLKNGAVAVKYLVSTKKKMYENVEIAGIKKIIWSNFIFISLNPKITNAHRKNGNNFMDEISFE